MYPSLRTLTRNLLAVGSSRLTRRTRGLKLFCLIRAVIIGIRNNRGNNRIASATPRSTMITFQSRRLTEMSARFARKKRKSPGGGRETWIVTVKVRRGKVRQLGFPVRRKGKR